MVLDKDCTIGSSKPASIASTFGDVIITLILCLDSGLEASSPGPHFMPSGFGKAAVKPPLIGAP